MKLEEESHWPPNARRTPRRDSQRELGGSRVNLILALLVLVVIIFLAVKVIPAYVDNYELQDAMQSECRFALANRKNDQQMRDDMFQKMQDLGIPGKADDLQVSLAGPDVSISLDYAVPVDLGNTHFFSLSFHAHGDNHTI